MDDSGGLVKGLGNNDSLEFGRGQDSSLGDDCRLRLRDLLDLGLGLDHLLRDALTGDGGRDWERLGLDERERTSVWVDFQEEEECVIRLTTVTVASWVVMTGAAVVTTAVTVFFLADVLVVV